MLKSYTTKLLLAAACFFSLSSTYAASTADNLSVSASVTQRCTIATTALNFGAYDPVVTNKTTALTGTGAVTLTCTKNAGSSTAVTITLGQGSNFSSSARHMVSGTDLLTYELYQPSATTPGASCPGTTIWGTAGSNIFTPSGTSWGATSPQTFNVCGTVAGGQDAPPGSYSDTVVATVNF